MQPNPYIFIEIGPIVGNFCVHTDGHIWRNKQVISIFLKRIKNGFIKVGYEYANGLSYINVCSSAAGVKMFSQTERQTKHINSTFLFVGFWALQLAWHKSPCFRSVLAVVCVLIAAGSCYELLLSRGKDINNQTADTVLPNHKQKTSLGKSNYSRQMKANARLT